MIGYLFAGLGLVAGMALMLRWFATAQPADVLKMLRWGLLFIGIALFLALALSGRLAWGIAALPALLPWVYRAMFLRRMWRGMKNWTRAAGGRGAPGATSDVETAFLRMSLDHETGEMSGIVIAGTFAGRALDDLSLADLLAFRAECAGDVDTVRVLEAYLDRTQGPNWRGAEHPHSGGTAGDDALGPMTNTDALEILGLKDGASADEIKAAHHRLMAAVHPDHGGSNYLAAKINRAREVLMDK